MKTEITDQELLKLDAIVEKAVTLEPEANTRIVSNSDSVVDKATAPEPSTPNAQIPETSTPVMTYNEASAFVKRLFISVQFFVNYVKLILFAEFAHCLIFYCLFN